MRINQIVGTRAAGTPLRFTAYVVEGERNNTPGRIRTIRFDKSGGDQIWLSVEWEAYGGVTRGRMAAYRVKSDMAAMGAFLLHDEYEAIGKMDVWEQFLTYQKGHVSGQHFPERLLPPRVQDLMKLKSKLEQGEWVEPEGDLSADAKPKKVKAVA